MRQNQLSSSELFSIKEESDDSSFNIPESTRSSSSAIISDSLLDEETKKRKKKMDEDFFVWKCQTSLAMLIGLLILTLTLQSTQLLKQ